MNEAQSNIISSGIKNIRHIQNQEYEKNIIETPVTKFYPRLNDTGNAERFAFFMDKIVRHCDDWKRWIIYDGKRWEIDRQNQIINMVKKVNRQMYREISKITDDVKRTETADYMSGNESNHRINAMLSIARSELPILPEDLDTQKMSLNLKNGTYDFESNKLREHNRDDFITKIISTDYNSESECPLWKSFLNRILDNNQHLIDFIQRVVGYSLTGDVSEDVFFILYGTGQNGKSTFLEVISSMLGEYACSIETKTLMTKQNDNSIPNDLARLKGARMVSAMESEEGKRLNEPLIKQLTGGDMITARFMRAEYFDFKPEFKLFLVCNHKPVIRGTDRAIWRRIRLIPFTVQIPDNEQDKHLPEKLKSELPGILSWAIEGYRKWQSEGLDFPDEVKRATESYRDEMDIIGDFLKERCEVKPFSEIKSSDLYREYKKWAEENGYRPMSQKAVAQRLYERGLKRERKTAGYVWQGITLNVSIV